MSSIAAASDVTDVQVVAADGDVILVVGEDKRKLCVSSHALSVSPVFRAMLGPNFGEGQQPRSSAKPAEIPLPEDRISTMRLICHLLHCSGSQHINVDFVDTTEFLELGHAITKYQVLDVLYWQIRGILSHFLLGFEGVNNAGELTANVAVAYLLDCDNAYTRASALFINQCTEPIVDLMDYSDYDTIVNILPLQVLFILEQRRLAMQEKLRAFTKEDVTKDEGLCLGCSKAGRQDREETCVGH